MALLKEDGSLDVERLRNLPFEEYIKEYNKLDKEQIREYWSRIPLYELQNKTRAVEIDNFIANNGVNATEFLNNMRQKYEKRR